MTTYDGRPLGDDHAGLHRDQVRGVPGGLVEVVQDGDERAPLLVQPRAQVHDLELVGDVEERGRLVEQQQVGLLREGHGQPHPLALPAGELGDEPVAQVGDLGGVEGVGDRARVGGGPLPQQPLVRVAAAGDQVADGDRLGRDRALREQGEAPGDVLALQRRDGHAVEQHLPRARLERAAERAQQRRLAAAVRAR